MNINGLQNTKQYLKKRLYSEIDRTKKFENSHRQDKPRRAAQYS